MPSGRTCGPTESTAELAKELELEEHCLFTGRVSHRLAKHYNSLASVLLSPRVEGTNTPLKLYEQMTSGIPIVATNIWSHTQIVDNSIVFLIEPEPEDMAQGITQALTSEEEAEQKAALAKDLYEKNYARPAYVNKMQQLLRHLS